MKVRALYFQAAGVAALMIVASAAHAEDMGDYQVRVEHAAARLVVIPEARNNVSVSVSHGPSRLPQLSVRQEGDHVVVEGGLTEGPFGGERIRCTGSYTVTHVGPLTHTLDSRAVIVGGVGRVAFQDLPVITARVPLNARVAGASAVFGEVGRTESLKVANAGCGDWTVGDVRGRLTVSQAGSGDVHAGAAGALTAKLAGSGDLGAGPIGGDAEVAVAGSGDVTLGAVTGALTAKLAGSGDIALASVGGPVQASMAASGDVRIHGGYAPHVRVSIAGSGDFSFDGRADSLNGSIVGSGDIYVAHVSGEVSKSVMGSGEVRAGR
jgi:hypothetical protein